MPQVAGLWQWCHRALRLLVAPALLIVLLVGFIVALEDRFIFFPSRELVGTPADLGLSYQDASFPSEALRLHGWFIPGRKDITWLWLHGNAGNISHRLENIAMINERLGVNIFIFDYRGYGQSEGTPSEQGTYRDAEAALAHLRGLPGVNSGRIVLFGRSLGAAVAVDLATREPVLGLILESPFTSIPAMAQAAYPFLPIGPLLRTRYDALSKIGNVTAPVLILHSRDDEVVPFRQGQELFEAAPQPKRFYPLSGAGHNDTHLRGGEGYWRALEDFLRDLRSQASP